MEDSGTQASARPAGPRRALACVSREITLPVDRVTAWEAVTDLVGWLNRKDRSTSSPVPRAS